MDGLHQAQVDQLTADLAEQTEFAKRYSHEREAARTEQFQAQAELAAVTAEKDRAITEGRAAMLQLAAVKKEQAKQTEVVRCQVGKLAAELTEQTQATEFAKHELEEAKIEQARVAELAQTELAAAEAEHTRNDARVELVVTGLSERLSELEPIQTELTQLKAIRSDQLGFPDYWDPFPAGQSHHEVELVGSTEAAKVAERDRVIQRFIQQGIAPAGGAAGVLSLKRIQDIHLWHR